MPGLYSRRKAIREGIDWAKQSEYDPREHKKQGYDARLDESLGDMRGGRILVDEVGMCMTAWIGSRVTPMVSEAERRVLRAMRGLPIVLAEEE